MSIIRDKKYELTKETRQFLELTYQFVCVKGACNVCPIESLCNIRHLLSLLKLNFFKRVV